MGTGRRSLLPPVTQAARILPEPHWKQQKGLELGCSWGTPEGMACFPARIQMYYSNWPRTEGGVC